MTEKPHMRTIRSFVVRAGRMTKGQQSAYDEYWPQWGLQSQQGQLNIEEVFQRQAPTVLEIGFGMGQSLAEQAAAQPEKNFIGIEVHTPGVGKLLQLCSEAGLDNVRVYQEDAIEVLKHCIPDQSIDTLQLFFPDPWHKKKHHKRRIVQPSFLPLIRPKLKTGGIFHMATDWQPYAEHMLEVMQVASGFRNAYPATQYAPRPESRPLTKFERRGHRLGHGVWDILYEKVAD